tara:strand:- start:1211 stop:1807 length:597 start_codon:yes stop_codon:yes gene_type:complete
MCTKGYIKLYRKILDNGIFENAELLKVFVWTIIRANTQPNTVFGRKLKVGQFVTGKLSAAEELQMRPTTVYDRIKKLEKLGYIKLESNTKNTVITVLKYNSYQGYDNGKRDLEAVYERFYADAMQHHTVYDKNVLESFIMYWTEPNRSKTKLRYELQPTFDIKRRLATWIKNNSKYETSEKPKIFDSWQAARNIVNNE